ncbi:MAG: ABC transporter ATP-binding protein [Chloroflexota bacterium]|nr:ABC transporter ATP-binding protein [Chloroflexota bacterium]
MEPRVRLRGGAFSYRDHPIFDGLDLDLFEGDAACLLGPNGCGKTTLLRCLNTILTLREGELWLNGQRADTFSETKRARMMGFIFQEHTIQFPYSVLDIVLMGRAPHLSFLAAPSKRDREIAEQALETVGIVHLRDHRYTEISGGERQLALIARALSQEPQILLLDEPTSHLDFGNQMLILKTISRLVREERIAVMMATHFPNHALLASTKVLLMRDGGFIAEGSPEDVITGSYLRQLYGVEVEVVCIQSEDGRQPKAVIPVLNDNLRGR